MYKDLSVTHVLFARVVLLIKSLVWWHSHSRRRRDLLRLPIIWPISIARWNKKAIFNFNTQTERHYPSYLNVDVGMAGNRLSDSYWWNWLDLVWTWSQAHATFCHISGSGPYLTARYLTRSEFFSWLGKGTNFSSSTEVSPASFWQQDKQEWENKLEWLYTVQSPSEPLLEALRDSPNNGCEGDYIPSGAG